MQNDELVTRVAVRIAAALREQVGPPDQWEVRPLRMGAEDDPDAQVMLWLRFKRPIGDTWLHWDYALSPHLITDNLFDFSGLARHIVRTWHQNIDMWNARPPSEAM